MARWSKDKKLAVGLGALAIVGYYAYTKGYFGSTESAVSGPLATSFAVSGQPDIATYVLDYQNTSICYPFTSLNIEQHLVPGSAGGHKNYGHFGVDVNTPMAVNLGSHSQRQRATLSYE